MGGQRRTDQAEVILGVGHGGNLGRRQDSLIGRRLEQLGDRRLVTQCHEPKRERLNHRHTILIAGHDGH
ncbi:MAG: hypothetical protein ACK55I_40185, partial [bacterium]